MLYRDVTLKVAQEADDVMVLAKELVRVMKTGGDFSTLVPQLFEAVKGVQQVPVEAHEDIAAVLASVSTRGVEIAHILIKPVTTLEGK